MIELVSTANYWLALCAIGLQLATGYLLVEHFFLRERYLAPYVARFALWILAGVGFASVLLTLVYSEVFGFVPCGLCWLQRVFLYPLPIIALVALWHRARSVVVVDIGIVLSALGAIVAFYQHYLQMGGSALVSCPTAGAGADCARRILFEFGYVTFPLMAASLFVFFIAVLLVYRRASNR